MISRSRLRFFGLLLTLLVLGAITGTIACKSAPAPTSTTPPPNTGISFAKDIQPIFSTNCVGCHQGGSAPAGLNLEPGSAYKNLANVKASEASLMRVAPGAPDKSYLLNKLLGTQSQVGGTGAQMPFRGTSLPQDQINLIQQWITDGAADN